MYDGQMGSRGMQERGFCSEINHPLSRHMAPSGLIYGVSVFTIAKHTESPYILRMHSVAETSIFTRRADALLSGEDRAALIGTLATDPIAGALVPGLGGIRKLRFAPAGRGKSGAFRVIYYYAAEDRPVLALLIYGKNEQENITPQQRDALLSLIAREKADRRATTGRAL